jgi:acyl carrier protein
MSDPNALAPQISALFAERLHVDVPSPDTDLLDSGLVDSLMFVEFLAQLEREFGIQVSLDDLEIDHFRTVSRIAQFVATKRNGGGASHPPHAPASPAAPRG